MILWSSGIVTWNNNFGDRFLIYTINGNVKEIICYWVLHNLRMVYNKIVKEFSEMFNILLINVALWNDWPQRIECSGCLFLLFKST